jgi:hypothetical protein
MVLIEKDTISMSLPANWAETKTSDLPNLKTGKIILSYGANEAKEGFFNNVVILEDTLDGLISSRKYSEVNNLQTTRNYLEYTKLEDESIIFEDGDESRLYVFEAKYNTTTPRMKFIQTAKVCGKSVYLIHFSLTLDKTSPAYKTLIQTFRCK